MIHHDFYCPLCDRGKKNVLHESSRPPRCCGEPMRIDWSHGQPPATDMKGTSAFYAGLDGGFSSTRQAEKAAKRRAEAWTSDMQRRGKNMSWKVDGCAGDKVGGAREIRQLGRHAFSYAKQASRTSTGERR